MVPPSQNHSNRRGIDSSFATKALLWSSVCFFTIYPSHTVLYLAFFLLFFLFPTVSRKTVPSFFLLPPSTTLFRKTALSSSPLHCILRSGLSFNYSYSLINILHRRYGSGLYCNFDEERRTLSTRLSESRTGSLDSVWSAKVKFFRRIFSKRVNLTASRKRAGRRFKRFGGKSYWNLAWKARLNRKRSEQRNWFWKLNLVLNPPTWDSIFSYSQLLLMADLSFFCIWYTKFMLTSFHEAVFSSDT